MHSRNFNSQISRTLACGCGYVAQLLILFALLTGLSGRVNAQTIGNVANGSTLYGSNKCAGCHNAPPDSRDGSRVFNGVDWGRIKAAVSNTVNTVYPGLAYRSSVSQDMAKYGAGGSSPLTDAQLKDISAYICSSLGSSAATCSAPAAGPPVVSISPTSLAFGNVQVATGSAAKVITLNNTGASPLAISGIAFSGVAAADFIQTNNCGASVAATTGRCTINVVFTPGAANARAASLVITHNTNNVAGSTSAVTLTGSGTAAPAPAVALDKTSLVFGSVLVGQTSAPQVVVVNNSGSAALALAASPFSLVGANAAEFSRSHNCPASLAAGSNCSVTVTYAPLSAGIGKAASLSISNSSGLPTLSVALSGDAANPVPALQVSLSSLAFGTQVVGSNSSQSVTLLNNGTGNVVFGATAFASGHAVFSQTNNCPSVLGVGAQCNLTVTFAPLVAASLTSSLTVTSNVTPAKVIALSGTAVVPVVNAPRINMVPGPLVFAAQIMNTRSVAQSVTVTNLGNSLLSVGAINFSGTHAADYAMVAGAGSCGASVGAAFSLAAASSCQLYITYTPLAVGASFAQLVATSDSVGGTFSISLSGTGLAVPAPIATTNAALLSYGGALVAGSSSAARTVTLSNSGNANLTGTFSVAGAAAGDFVVVSGAGSCLPAGYSLAPAASCSVYVQFHPLAAGSSSASLVFATNAAVSPVVTLSGTAGAAPAPVGNLYGAGDWGPVQVNRAGLTRTFTVSSDGNASLVVNLVRITGAAASDFSVSSTCTAAVAASQTCTINLGFTPGQIGARDAVLEVSTNAAVVPLTLALHGTGSATDVAGEVANGFSASSALASAGTQSGGSGGCTAGDPRQGLLDPSLWILCLTSALLLARRRKPDMQATERQQPGANL